jgi:hypothetical protein
MDLARFHDGCVHKICFAVSSGARVGETEGTRLCLDRVFCCCWFMCPFTVASALLRYLRTLYGDNAGHPVKFPASMALIQVSLMGLKHAAWR